MRSNPSKSVSLSSLFIAGLVAMLSLSGCVAASEDVSCERGERGASAAFAGEDESACGGESAEQDAPSEDEVVSPREPSLAPQTLCSPFCDRI